MVATLTITNFPPLAFSSLRDNGDLQAYKAGSSIEATQGSSDRAVAIDWRRLISSKSVDDGLEFVSSPSYMNGEVCVVPSSDTLKEGLKQWQNSIVAQVVGRTPNFSYFQKMVQILWGSNGEVTTFPASHNMFMLKFSTAELRNKVLESDPWYFHNQLLILKKWERGLKSLDLSMSKLPVWLYLHNVPLEMFTKKGLSCIASAIDKTCPHKPVVAAKVWKPKQNLEIKDDKKLHDINGNKQGGNAGSMKDLLS
ncbi:hypothetical protein PTKIN_Ptkin08bG0125400 [Pterospermum kingtungense]